MLDAEHIRYARANQLARLLGVSLATVSRWNSGSFRSCSLDAAVAAGVPREVLVVGLDKRRADAERQRSLQTQVDQYLNDLISQFGEDDPHGA